MGLPGTSQVGVYKYNVGGTLSLGQHGTEPRHCHLLAGDQYSGTRLYYRGNREAAPSPSTILASRPRRSCSSALS